MKTLRRLLLISALLLAGFACTGCDDDDNLPFAGGAWIPVSGVLPTTSASASGSSTP